MARKRKPRRKRKITRAPKDKNLLTGTLKKAKSFLLFPAKAFKAEEKTNLNESFKYALIGLVFLGVLTGLVAMVIPMAMMPFAGPIIFVTMLVAIVIFGFFGILLSGLWLHLWAYLLGARKGLNQTIKVVMYSKTPSYYLGWIPIFSFFASIWSLVIGVIGLKQLQKLSTARAIGAVLISIIIPLVVIGFIFIAVLTTAVAAGSMPNMFCPMCGF